MNLLLKILLACCIIAFTCLLILGAYAVYQSLKKEDKPHEIRIYLPKDYIPVWKTCDISPSIDTGEIISTIPKP